MQLKSTHHGHRQIYQGRSGCLPPLTVSTSASVLSVDLSHGPHVVQGLDEACPLGIGGEQKQENGRESLGNVSCLLAHDRKTAIDCVRSKGKNRFIQGMREGNPTDHSGTGGH